MFRISLKTQIQQDKVSLVSSTISHITIKEPKTTPDTTLAENATEQGAEGETNVMLKPDTAVTENATEQEMEVKPNISVSTDTALSKDEGEPETAVKVNISMEPDTDLFTGNRKHRIEVKANISLKPDTALSMANRKQRMEIKAKISMKPDTAFSIDNRKDRMEVKANISLKPDTALSKDNGKQRAKIKASILMKPVVTVSSKQHTPMKWVKHTTRGESKKTTGKSAPFKVQGSLNTSVNASQPHYNLSIQMATNLTMHFSQELPQSPPSSQNNTAEGVPLSTIEDIYKRMKDPQVRRLAWRLRMLLLGNSTIAFHNISQQLATMLNKSTRDKK
nr:PREDICTED: uncharacterized protein LOC106705438 [Latimeria chalumnae]|eukprot:XP_014350379.1 PREDICTED: uncharacterized protein LOC106705438 [Latimeria chalumnae]